eukprot:jgi/Tetstr1/443014/TSEL_031074.t1
MRRQERAHGVVDRERPADNDSSESHTFGAGESFTADSDFVRDTVTGFPHPPGDTGAATKAPLGGEEDEEVLDLDNVGEDGDMKDGEPDSADGTVASGGRGGG